VKEWHFLGLGVLTKQLRSWRKGIGVERQQIGVEEARRSRSVPGAHRSESQHHNVRNNTAHKEN
jgi:hypothetical protein